MTHELKVLCIHGLGDHRLSSWKRDWSDALRRALPVKPATPIHVEFIEYDHLFADVEITFADSLSALRKLIGSGVSDLLGWEVREGRYGAARSKDLFERGCDRLRWTAGYVVAWVDNEPFRKAVRAFVSQRLEETAPDILIAHSLGSLIAYDALIDAAVARESQRMMAISDLTFVSLGSQIGSPFVRANLLPGRVLPLPVKFWFHLFNPFDDVFTARIDLPGVPNFRQVVVPIEHNRWPHHDAVDYIDDEATVLNAWSPAVKQLTGHTTVRFGGDTLTATPVRALGRSPHRKAQKKCLLVGINDYPQAAARLSGCVNDVYLMSSLLQEIGFSAEDIRIVLNDRATARGIISRMEWLLDDVLPGDQLIFYYSGHGARLPGYNSAEEVDHVDETLVPFDFDWTPDTSIADDKICELYSQLHYDTRLTMIFDCCHSGGIHRQGAPRVKGVDPPDDIRHRALRWDESLQMWVARELESRSRSFAKSTADAAEYVGREGNVRRLGRAIPLRESDADTYDSYRRLADNLSLQKDFGRVPYGPYLPVILEACAEDDYAYEYRHGAESFGAFTFVLAKCVRELRRGSVLASVPVESLIHRVATELTQIGLKQQPGWIGPAVRTSLFA